MSDSVADDKHLIGMAEARATGRDVHGVKGMTGWFSEIVARRSRRPLDVDEERNAEYARRTLRAYLAGEDFYKAQNAADSWRQQEREKKR